MFQNMAVAYEEHPEASRALNRALDLAKVLQLRLTVLTVAEPLPAYAAFSAAADPSAIQFLEQDRARYYAELNERLAGQAAEQGVELATHILEGSRVDAIVSFISLHKVDLLVVGLHRHVLRVASLWSEVYSLSQSLPCSILGVH